MEIVTSEFFALHDCPRGCYDLAFFGNNLAVWVDIAGRRLRVRRHAHNHVISLLRERGPDVPWKSASSLSVVYVRRVSKFSGKNPETIRTA